MTKNKPKVLRATCDHSGPNKLRVHMSDKDYDALQYRVKELESIIAQMRRQIDSDYQELLSKNANVSGLMHRNQELEKQCEQLKSELYKRNEQISSLSAKLDAYESRNAELENTLKSGPAELAAAYESLKHVVHKRGERMEYLEKRLKEAKAAADRYRHRALSAEAEMRGSGVEAEVNALLKAGNAAFTAEQALQKQAEVWARRADQAMSRAVVAQDRLDLLVSTLGSLFGWKDTSYLHAVMHVENAVNNLKADAGVRRWEENKEKKNE